MMQEIKWAQTQTAEPVSNKEIFKIWGALNPEVQDLIAISFNYNDIIYIARNNTIAQYSDSLLNNSQNIKIWQQEKASS